MPLKTGPSAPYFFTSAVRFATMVIGSALPSLSALFSKKCFPSGITSYWQPGNDLNTGLNKATGVPGLNPLCVFTATDISVPSAAW